MNKHKASKKEVDYRQGSQQRHCSLCTMFRGPSGCTAVDGAVSANGLCDYFDRRSR